MATDETKIKSLMEMGFPRFSCVEALTASKGNVEAATEILLRGDTPVSTPAAPTEDKSPLHKKQSTSKLIRTSGTLAPQAIDRKKLSASSQGDGDWGEEDVGAEEDSSMFADGGDDETWFGAAPDPGEEKMYKVLERQQLEEMLLKQVKEVSSQLALGQDEAQHLLKYFGWRYEKLQNAYFDKPEYYLEQAGVKPPQQPPAKRPAVMTCMVCWTEISTADSFALSCGHAYCNDCWQQHFTVSVAERGPNVVSTRCMFPGCTCKPGYSAWKKLAPPATFERYFYFMIKDFVERNGKYSFCVNPSCGRAIQFLGAGKPSVVVECSCGQRFCFACGFEQHNPVSCDILNKWRERNSDDEESVKLVKATSKACFHCGFPTERNQGCNHMTCSRCRGEWCWMCRGDWKTHGSHTGGFYSCNKYDVSDAKKIDDWAGKFLEDSKRYQHFFERYFNHDVARRQLAGMADQLRKKAQEYGVSQHANYEAIGEAITLILECRLILKYTYVYGFYLDPKDKGVPFFEYVQANAEGICERISTLVTSPIEKLDLDQLKNLIGVTRKYISNLAKAIENGLSSDS